MRLVLAASAALVLSCVAASADSDAMSSRFGNTVVAKTPNGPEIHMYYNADHTFTGKVIGMDYPLKGTWTAEGGNICLNYNPPPQGITNPTCVAAEAHQVGDTWTANGRTVTLVQGIQ